VAGEQPLHERPAVWASVSPGLVRDLRRNQASRTGDVLHVAEPISEAGNGRLRSVATLIAMADTDETIRLRLLRAIRDLGLGFPGREGSAKRLLLVRLLFVEEVFGVDIFQKPTGGNRGSFNLFRRLEMQAADATRETKRAELNLGVHASDP